MTLRPWERKTLACIVAAVALVLVVIALSGCSVLESRGLFAACRAADTVTTIQVIRAGGVEQNPILRQVVMGHHWFLFVAIQAGITWFVWDRWHDIPKTLQPAVNVIACTPVPNNIAVLREQRAMNAAAGR